MLESGDRVGALEILGVLGQGGQGVVYRARDIRVGRPCALKIIPGDRHRDECAHRLLREARIVGRITSPHVVMLYHVHDLDGGGVGLEMELIQGGTLREALRRGPLDPAHAVRIAAALIKGLHVAHEAGVVHRDLKPENVFLCPSAAAKIGDFGVSAPPAASSITPDNEEALRGTLAYMSPESLHGATPAPAADLWSLGVLAYEMCAGQRPFRAASAGAMVAQILSAPLPSLPAHTPPSLAALIRGCLVREPASRLASAAACQDVLVARQRQPQTRVQPMDERAPHLVGRSKEVERIREHLAPVGAQRGRTVLLSGVAGVGKTALAAHVLATAAPQGTGVIRAQAAPLASLAKSLLAGIEGWLLETGRTDSPDAFFASDVFGGDQHSVGSIVGAMKAPSSMVPPEAPWALERVVSHLAASGPLALLLEDIHHCSESEFESLRQMAIGWHQHAIALICTARTERSGTCPAAALTANLTEALHVRVGPLNAASAYALLDERCDSPLPPDMLRAALKRASGIPLFIEEMVRHIQALPEGVSWADVETAVPTKLRELITHRMNSAPDELRDLFEAAAIDGETFDGRAVAALLQIEPEQALRRLHLASRRGSTILPTERGFRFNHGLFQEVVYTSMAPELRTVLHRRLAQHLDERAVSETVDPERIGRHWERAGDVQRARPHLLRAVAACMLVQDHARAIDLATRAGLLRVERAPQLDPPTWTLLLRVIRGKADHEGPRKAVPLLRDVVRAAGAQGNARLERAAAVWLSDIGFLSGGAAALSASALWRAVIQLPDGLHRGRAYHLLGQLDHHAGRVKRAKTQFHRAIRVLDATGLKNWSAGAEHELGSIACAEVDLAQAGEHFNRAETIAQTTGMRQNAQISRLLGGYARLLQGKTDGLEKAMREAIDELEMRGARASAGYARVHLAQVHGAEGRFDVAETELQRAILSLKRLGPAHGLFLAHLEAAHLAFMAGDTTRTRAGLADAEHALAGLGYTAGEVELALARATLEGVVGHSEAASQQVRHATDLALRSGTPLDRAWTARLLIHAFALGVRSFPDVAYGRLCPDLAGAPALDQLATYGTQAPLGWIRDQNARDWAARLAALASALPSRRAAEHEAGGQLLVCLSTAPEHGPVALQGAVTATRSLRHAWLEISLQRLIEQSALEPGVAPTLETFAWEQIMRQAAPGDRQRLQAWRNETD